MRAICYLQVHISKWDVSGVVNIGDMVMHAGDVLSAGTHVEVGCVGCG